MKNKTFKERYLVRFCYTNGVGFRVCSAEEYVYVDVKHGVNEKNNHEEAGKVIERKYNINKVKIICVKYC